MQKECMRMNAVKDAIGNTRKEAIGMSMAEKKSASAKMGGNHRLRYSNVPHREAT